MPSNNQEGSIIMKSSYPCNCAYCGKEHKVWPSLLQQMGIENAGNFECPDCGKTSMLEINLQTNERMESKKMEGAENEHS